MYNVIMFNVVIVIVIVADAKGSLDMVWNWSNNWMPENGKQFSKLFTWIQVGCSTRVVSTIQKQLCSTPKMSCFLRKILFFISLTPNLT